VAEEKLIVDFWDVGQGDGTVIRLPDGRLLLIDVGPKGSPIIDWLADRSAPIHAVVITHNDEDHAGSLPSLVKMPGIPIQTVYMLLDRDKGSLKFQNIWRPVREEERKGRLSVLALTRNTIIWEAGGTRLQVLYPSFSENIEANRPNETSAIVCLIHNDVVKIIWPGDAPMRILANKCGNELPFLLHGPHHGGPVDRKMLGFKTWVEAFVPERVFVSVGTNNNYGLPSSDYLKIQRARGCRVICTELTDLCDHNHIRQQQPVLQTAALLGLRPPRKGVSCRGCFRVSVQGGELLPDRWDAEHISRIKKLRRPKCLGR
jgi:competence protein ComEC